MAKAIDDDLGKSSGYTAPATYDTSAQTSETQPNGSLGPLSKKIVVSPVEKSETSCYGSFYSAYIDEYPQTLEGRVTREEWRQFITSINDICREFKFDSKSTSTKCFTVCCCLCTICFSWYPVWSKDKSHTERLENYLEEQNRVLFKPRGMRVVGRKGTEIPEVDVYPSAHHIVIE